MLVSHILKAKGDRVFTVGPDETLQAAAAGLGAKRVGAMVVLAVGGGVAGIVSERDVARVVGESGAAALERPVSEVMSRDVVFAEPTGWFAGANLLRSKLPAATQINVRNMRREWLKAGK